MFRNAIRATVLLSTLLGCHPFLAAEPDSVQRSRDSLWRYLEARGPSLHISQPRKELREKSVTVDERTNSTHFKMQQLYMGVPVWDGDLIAHVAANGEVTSTDSLKHPTGIKTVVPKLTADDARSFAMSSVRLLAEPDHHSEEILIYDAGEGAQHWVLAWHVILEVTAPGRPVGRWRCIVDAATGDVLLSEDLIKQVAISATTGTFHTMYWPGSPLQTSILKSGNAYLMQDP